MRDPIKVKEQNRRYKQSHKLQISILSKQYHQKMKIDSEYIRKRQEYANKPEVKERHRELDRISSKKPHRKLTRKDWEEKHRQKLKEYKNEWNKKNQDKIRESRKKWKLNNPEKVVKSYQKSRKAQTFVVRWGLQSWSKLIQNIHKHKCQVCENRSTLVHHIFFKSLYPKLQFNLNNGIPLCDKCHAEIHWPLLKM